MAQFDANSILTGGFIGVVVTGFVTLTGHFLNRYTKIDTSKIDDRSKFTKDLMSQAETLYTKQGELSKALEMMQRREITFIRLFANVGGELRVLNGSIVSLFNDVAEEGCEKTEIKRRLLEFRKSVLELNRMIDNDNLYLAQIRAQEESEARKERLKNGDEKEPKPELE